VAVRGGWPTIRPRTSTSYGASRSAAADGGQGTVEKLAPNAGPNITGGMMPVNCAVRPEDSHTWGLFESEMQESWYFTVGPALGQ
jgi:diacylglycerol O-acyltransferase/trehalose O-mycolyltransferase